MRILISSECSLLNTGYGTMTYEIARRLQAAGCEVAELASYATAGDERLASIPWRVYPVQPNPNNQEAVSQYEADPHNQFGKLMFNPAVLDFRPDAVCVPPGELVMTDAGYRVIESIRPGDFVLTHRGRWRKVTESHRTPHDGEVVRIHANGYSEPIVVTENHPVYIIKQKNRTKYARKHSLMYKDAVPEFVPAKDVEVGDFVVCVPPSVSEPLDKIRITDYLTQFYVADNKVHLAMTALGHPIPEYVSLDEDFGWLLGWVIGDGCIHPRAVEVCFGINELHHAEKFKDILYKLFGLNCTINKPEKINMWLLHISSVLLADFLREICGEARNRKIPSFSWFASDSHRRGLISALILSDGRYGKNTVGIDTSYRRLAYEYRMLLLMSQIPVSVLKRSSNYKDKFGNSPLTFAVQGHGCSAAQLHSIAKKYDAPEKASIEHVDGRYVWMLNGMCVSRVKRVRRSAYRGQVYNLTVDEDNSYTLLHSCVHNCDFRDPWYQTHIQLSPLRPFFRYLYIPTVDAVNQKDEWLDAMSMADAIGTYTDWAHEVLLKEAGGRLPLVGSISPGTDYDLFRPLANRDELRAAFGLPQDALVCGFVSRNQIRKRFPEMAAAFSRFLQEAPSYLRDRVILYWHTSWPDLGWDIASVIRDSGIANRIWLTHLCKACKSIFSSRWLGVGGSCPKCGQNGVVLPNTNNGVPREHFKYIYNLFDVYCQYANSEGLGLGLLEAAACGVPIMGLDYSGMADVLAKLEGYPIKPAQFYSELETGCRRAIPCEKDFAAKLIEVLSLPEPVRRSRGANARDLSMRHYNYDRMAQKILQVFLGMGVRASWDVPKRVHRPAQQIPQGLSNSDFVRWGFAAVAGRPELAYSTTALRMTRDLDWGYTLAGATPYFSDETFLGRARNGREITREVLMDIWRSLANEFNYWEEARCGK